MNTLDFVLIGIIVLCVVIGYLRGIIAMIGSFVAMYVAFFGASYVQQLLADAIKNNIPENSQGTVNMILFFIVLAVIWFGVNMVVKAIDLATSVPIVGGLKHMLGALLGLVQGVVIVGVACVALRTFNISDSLNTMFEESKLADIAIKLSPYIIGILPQDYREVATLMKKVK
jgi:membrane protein required for colicin V production